MVSGELEPSKQAVAVEPEKFSVWASFHKKMANVVQTTNKPAIQPILEMRQYEEEDPLEKHNGGNQSAPYFPNLQNKQKKKKNFLAPPQAYRLFLALGELISHRRSGLSEESFNIIGFLNENRFL